MRTRVKICGITSAQDALAAVEAGADAIGFVFWPSSPRAVAPAVAGAIGAQVPAFVTRVGVFVNASPDEVRRTVVEARLNAVQLHGDEEVEAYFKCGLPLIRATAVQAQPDVVSAVAHPPQVTLLLDASDSTLRGGTGQMANWKLARLVAEKRPVILAGGLNPGNVGDAIRAVRPWAVDLSSGVESSPGRKSARMMEDMLAAVAVADRRMA